jgi:hypothetical protein
MLKMKPKCETCQTETAMDSLAYICSFECTFCESCTQSTHKGVCPNCSGELLLRPKRTRSPVAVASEQVKHKLSNVFSSKSK